MTQAFSTLSASSVYGQKNPLEMVQGFHTMYEVPTREKFTLKWDAIPELGIDENDLNMRIGLLREEAEEIRTKGIDKDYLFEIADGIGDLIWVCYSLALSTGTKISGDFALPRISRVPEIDIFARSISGNIMSNIDRTIEGIQSLADQNSHKDSQDESTEKYFRLAIERIIKEAIRLAGVFHIDMKFVLHEIALSNASKLAADGSVLRHTTPEKFGKVAKGPNFFDPKLATAFINQINQDIP